MKDPINPFITIGYISSDYFCDREDETQQLIGEVVNGNNVVLVSTRRMGKSGLIHHCFNNEQLKKGYHTFYVDIYATKSLRDFIFALSKEILNSLKNKGKKDFQVFWERVKSLQAGISFDVSGTPSFNLSIGDINDEKATLDEIFDYLSHAASPSIIAIDEFQQIATYGDDNIEAILRTYIQNCVNAKFIFAGSQHHVISNMFLEVSRPFYQSASMMYLHSIPLNKYSEFAIRHFHKDGKVISKEIIEKIYTSFDGITWYMQKILNALYSSIDKGGAVDEEMVDEAISNIVASYAYSYADMLFRLPAKQKDLLVAIAKEGEAKATTSGAFVSKYKLTSPSSVQTSQRILLAKDYITAEQGVYKVYDRFLRIWLNENW